MISLLSYQIQNETILKIFITTLFIDFTALFLLASNKLIDKVEKKNNYSSLKTKVITYNILSEIQQYDRIIQSVHKYNCLTKMKDQLSIVELVFFNANIDNKACTQTAFEKLRFDCRDSIAQCHHTLSK